MPWPHRKAEPCALYIPGGHLRWLGADDEAVETCHSCGHLLEQHTRRRAEHYHPAGPFVTVASEESVFDQTLADSGAGA